jgi:hypothetical protein
VAVVVAGQVVVVAEDLMVAQAREWELHQLHL